MGIDKDINGILEELYNLNTPEDPDKVGRIRKNIFIISHNPLYYKAAWYYKLGSGEFYYTEHKEGHEAMYKLDKSGVLVRGRLFEYQGIRFGVVYFDPELSPVSKLSENTLLDIKYKLETHSKKKVDFVFNDSGDVLLENRSIELRSKV